MDGFVVLVRFVLEPGMCPEFEALVLENARASVRDEPGCRRFDVLKPRSGGDEIVLYEIYDNQAAFAAHKSMPHYLAFKEATGAKTYGYGPHGAGRPARTDASGDVRLDASGDTDFAPDVTVGHGDVVEGRGWRVEGVRRGKLSREERGTQEENESSHAPAPHPVADRAPARMPFQSVIIHVSGVAADRFVASRWLG